MFKSYELNLPIESQGFAFKQALDDTDNQIQALEALASTYDNAARQCRTLITELQTGNYSEVEVNGKQECIYLTGPEAQLESLVDLHIIQLFEYDDEGGVIDQDYWDALSDLTEKPGTGLPGGH